MSLNHTAFVRGLPKGLHWTLCGHSRSLERTGFLLEAGGCKIMLDAGVGWKTPTSHLDCILITHMHIDHCNAMPMLLRCGDSDPVVLAPRAHVNNLREMCRMTWSVKKEDGSAAAGSRQDIELPPPLTAGAPCVKAIDYGVRGTQRDRLWVPLEPANIVELPGKHRSIVIQTVRCFHSVQDLGYVISEKEASLVGADPEAEALFQSLKEQSKVDKKAGKEIGALRKAGRLVNQEKIMPRVAYLLDTTVQVWERCQACQAGQDCIFAVDPYRDRCGDEEEIAAQRALILSCGTVIVECTFLAAGGMSEEEALTQAIERSHTAWQQLKPTILANPSVIFVLTHFSCRYNDEDIVHHFKAEGFPPNVMLWLDSGVVEAPSQPGASPSH